MSDKDQKQQILTWKVGKLEMMIQDNLSDWSTFLRIYGENVSNDDLLDQICKLFLIKKETKLNINSHLKSLYEADDKTHMVLMNKQFMLQEPVSTVLFDIYTLFKFIFELLIEKFVKTRNEYLDRNNIKGVKRNDWSKLLEMWVEQYKLYDLSSSSIILLFLNPPLGKSGIHYKIPGKEDIVEKLRDAIYKYHYPGFCTKVPHQRLTQLVCEFPWELIMVCIKQMDDSASLPDIGLAIDIICKGLEDLSPLKWSIDEKSIPREINPYPENDSRSTKWYVESILNLRQKLKKNTKVIENYHIETAKKLTEVYNEVYKALSDHL